MLDPRSGTHEHTGSRRASGRVAAILPANLAANLPAVFAAIVALGGCVGTEGETCDVATSDISAVALVIDSGWDIRASIDFEIGDRRGRNAPLRLCDSDHLTINGTEPVETEKADRVEYSLSLPIDGARSFRYELQRDAQGDQVAFEIDLPPAFELLAPMDGDAVDFAQDQRVEWEPAVDGGSMRVALSETIGGGDCLVTTTAGHTYETAGGVTVADGGQWTIPGGAVVSMGTHDCTVTYTLSRIALASYPSALQRSGRVEGRTERYVDVVVLR